MRGLTLRTLAARMLCSSSYISKIEVGKTAPAEPAFLSRLAIALELTSGETKLLFHSAATSQRVIELEGQLSTKAYEISYLFARRLAMLTDKEITAMEQILNRSNAEKEEYEDVN